MPRDRHPGTRQRIATVGNPPGVPDASRDLVVRAVRALEALLPGVAVCVRHRVEGPGVEVSIGLTEHGVEIVEEAAARLVKGEQTAQEAIGEAAGDGSSVGWRRERHNDKEQG